MKDRWQADRANLIQNWISNWKWVKTITILIASHVIVLQWNSLFLWQLYSTVIKSYLVTSCKFSIEVAQEWHFAKTKKLQKKNQFHSLCIMNCIRPSGRVQYWNAGFCVFRLDTLTHVISQSMQKTVNVQYWNAWDGSIKLLPKFSHSFDKYPL